MLANGILWNKRIHKENKKRIYYTTVKNIIMYNSEVRPVKDKAEHVESNENELLDEVRKVDGN